MVWCGIEMGEALSYTCPKCGKTIRSLYPNQLDANIQAHETKHKIDETKSVVKKQK